jgi:hypothetical protein
MATTAIDARRARRNFINTLHQKGDDDEKESRALESATTVERNRVSVHDAIEPPQKEPAMDHHETTVSEIQTPIIHIPRLRANTMTSMHSIFSVISKA